MKISKIFFYLLPFGVFVLILLLMNAYQYFSIRTQFTEGLVSRIAKEELSQLVKFIDDIEEQLRVAQSWGENGVLLVDDTDQINKKLFPFLEHLKGVESIIVANNAGQEYFITRKNGSVVTRALTQQGNETVMKYSSYSSTAEPDSPVSSWEETVSYDPRQRPWFRSPQNRGKVHWTPLYKFFQSGKYGTSASVAWTDPTSSDSFTVMAVDVSLDGLKEILDRQAEGKPGLLFIVKEDGDSYVRGSVDVNSAEMSDQQLDGIINESLVKWQEQGQATAKPVRVVHSGQTWITSYQKIRHDQGVFWLGVTMPEDAFESVMGNRLLSIETMELVIACIGAAIILLILRASGLLGRHPESTLSPNERIMSLIDQGEGAAVEFKSTIRTHIKTEKQGKEIEIAWLKAVVAFLNSEGGTVLIGVDDHGEIVGLEADKFDSGDHCLLHIKNVINRNIGAQYSGVIQIDLLQIQEKEVALIECLTSPDPVFLKIGKNEEFYVRSGPSSMKLSPSQMISYVQKKT